MIISYLIEYLERRDAEGRRKDKSEHRKTC